MEVQSQAFFQSLGLNKVFLDLLPGAYIVLRTNGEIVYWNEKADEWFALSGKKSPMLLDSVYPPDRPLAERVLREGMLEGRTQLESRVVKQDGSITYISVSASFMQVDGEWYAFSYGTDIADFKGTMGFLEQQNAYLESQVISRVDEIAQLQEMNTLVLDAAPYGAVLWDAELSIIAVNAAMLRLLKVENAEEYKTNFAKYFPPLQPNGMESQGFIKEQLKESFAQGKAKFEWTYQDAEGNLIPCMVNHVRLDIAGSPHLAAYVRDLREVRALENMAQARLQEVARTEKLVEASNTVARLLLASDEENFDQFIWNVLETLGTAVHADRVYIWRNKVGQDTRLYADQIYEWSPGVEPLAGQILASDVSYDDVIPTWYEAFIQGKSLKGIVRYMSPSEQEQLVPQGILSILLAPIFLSGGLWGFIGFDDCTTEREWSRAEEEMLEASGFLIGTGIHKHEAIEALRIAKEEAEEATRVKGDFLARMSHEIRTPMNAILGMCYLCLQTELDKVQKGYITKVRSAATLLLGIINDILDFSKLEAKKLVLEQIPFAVDVFLEDLMDIVSVRAEEKHLELLCKVDPNVPKTLVGDSLRIQQVLLNLTTNAIKFTEKGSVLLSLECLTRSTYHAEIRFAVTDTGIGLSQQEVAHLFEPFSQADSSTTRRFGGTGLGLSISKELVELMGGHIFVESKVGQGSTFAFVLSLEVGEESSTARSALSLDALRGTKVLVVDDNASARDTMQEILTSFAFDVGTVASGEEALEALIRANMLGSPYAVVLLDWKMPGGIDGLETARRIREFGAHGDRHSEIFSIPLMLMVSGYQQEMVIDAESEKIVEKFLTKPINPSALLNALVDVLGEQNGYKASLEALHGQEAGAGNIQAATVGSGFDAEEPATEKAEKPFAGLRILLVEDNDINQEIASELLAQVGVEVTVASNGQEAVEKAEKQEFDLILMDIQMPVMDGLEATRRIRAMPHVRKDLPIIAMTAHALVDDKEKSLEAGMDEHITKPIDPPRLFSTLGRWIKKPVKLAR